MTEPLPDAELDRLDARHFRTTKPTMEPDPADPSLIRQTAYCQWCAINQPEDDPRWPCPSARLVAEVRRLRAVEAAVRVSLEPQPDIGSIGQWIDAPEVKAWLKRQRKAGRDLRAALRSRP